jgi:hypothetical protein
MSLGLLYYLAETLSFVGKAMAIVGFLGTCISFIFLAVSYEEGLKTYFELAKKYIKIFLIILIVSVFIPKNKTDYLIIFGIDKVADTIIQSAENGTIKNIEKLVDVKIDKLIKEYENEQ